MNLLVLFLVAFCESQVNYRVPVTTTTQATGPTGLPFMPDDSEFVEEYQPRLEFPYIRPRPLNPNAIPAFDVMPPRVRNASPRREQYYRQLPSIAAQDVPEENSRSICSICRDVLSRESVSRMNCRHYFHTACINRWLQVNDRCPECRR